MVTTVQKTVVALATQAVKAYLKDLESYEKPVIQDRNPEDLHQMRVSLRRLRTVMQVFAPTISLPKAGRESQVAAIASKLGGLRDLDVITDTLKEQYLLDLPDAERKELTVVFGYLSKKRKKAYKQAKLALKSNRYKACKRSLYQWILDPDCNNTARLEIETVLPDLTLPLVSHLWLHPGWLIEVKNVEGQFKPDSHLKAEDMDAVIATHSNTLHSLRKQVKRVRYNFRLVSEFYGDRLKPQISKFAELQEALGILQDSLVMEDLLQQALPKWEKLLPTLKALLVSNRYRGWQRWQSLQEDYLQTESREDFRYLLMQPGTKNVSSEKELHSDRIDDGETKPNQPTG